jgi:hypothetical protein
MVAALKTVAESLELSVVVPFYTKLKISRPWTCVLYPCSNKPGSLSRSRPRRKVPWSRVIFIGAQNYWIGLSGEYAGRIYGEVRRRPRYGVREVLE